MTKIIGCFAAVGKTYTAKKNKAVLDFVVMPYKYKSCLAEFNQEKENEKDKGMHFDLIYNWQEKYTVDLIEHYYSNIYSYILIPTDISVLDILNEHSIPYSICIPEKMPWDRYKQRLINRGNTQDFIEIMEYLWYNILDTLRYDNNAEKIIEINENEYLSDVIEKF